MIHEALADVIGPVAEAAIELVVDPPTKHKARARWWAVAVLLIAAGAGIAYFGWFRD